MSSVADAKQPKKGGSNSPGLAMEVPGAAAIEAVDRDAAPIEAVDRAAGEAGAAAPKSKAQLRAERRAVQEAQRTAKAAGKPLPPQQSQKPAGSEGGRKEKQQQQQKPSTSGEGSKAETKKEKQQQKPSTSGEDNKAETKKEKLQQKPTTSGEGGKDETKKQYQQQHKPTTSGECGKEDNKKEKQQQNPPGCNVTKPEAKTAEHMRIPAQVAVSESKKHSDRNQSKTQKQPAPSKPPGEGKQQQVGGHKKKAAAATAGPLLPSFLRHLEAPIDADQLTSGLFNEYFAESQIEAAFVQLALMVAHEQLQGPSARCLGLALALRQLLGDVPAQDLPRLLKAKLDPNMRLLRAAKPLTVMEAHLEQSLADWVQESSGSDNSEGCLLNRIDNFVKEQIDTARHTIVESVARKINQGDAIMLYKPSSLVFNCLQEIVSKLPDMNIILLDTPPNWEGQAFLLRLRADPLLKACPVRYALLSAAPSLLSDKCKLVLEGHALTANGNVLAPVGTAYLANVAWSHRIPCLVLYHGCQTSDKVLIDSVSYNELGRVSGDSQLCNIQFDLTPGDLVTALITERGILPCTGSPVLPH